MLFDILVESITAYITILLVSIGFNDSVAVGPIIFKAPRARARALFAWLTPQSTIADLGELGDYELCAL